MIDYLGSICKKAVVACIKELSQLFPGRTEAKHDKLELRWPVSWPRFESGTSGIRNKST
jgi:hypothetical protein